MEDGTVRMGGQESGDRDGDAVGTRRMARGCWSRWVGGGDAVKAVGT